MATSEAKESEPATKPVKVIRLGGVSASIFANQGKSDGRDFTFLKVSGVQRSYKVGDEWKHTTSFGRDDLPLVILALKRAWEFMLDTEAARGKDNTSE